MCLCGNARSAGFDNFERLCCLCVRPKRSFKRPSLRKADYCLAVPAGTHALLDYASNPLTLTLLSLIAEQQLLITGARRIARYRHNVNPARYNTKLLAVAKTEAGVCFTCLVCVPHLQVMHNS
jgi:hypothetical protein